LTKKNEDRNDSGEHDQGKSSIITALKSSSENSVSNSSVYLPDLEDKDGLKTYERTQMAASVNNKKKRKETSLKAASANTMVPEEKCCKNC